MIAEITFLWIAVAIYLANALISWVTLLWSHQRLSRLILPVLGVGLLVHAVPLVSRWIRVGHGPYLNTLEILSASVWVGLFLLAALALARKEIRLASGPILLLAVTLLGWATLSDPEVQPLPPSFRSPWLIVHIAAAKVAFGSILVAAGLSVVTLIRSRRSAAAPDGGTQAESLVRADRLSHRLVSLGFVFVAFMIAAGAIWAREAWGSYWSWDPLESWSLSTWVAYGLALHARVTFKVRGRAWALMVLGLLALSIFAFFVAALFLPTVHVEYMM